MKRNEKKTYSSWMVKYLRNTKEHSIIIHSLGHYSKPTWYFYTDKTFYKQFYFIIHHNISWHNMLMANITSYL